MFLNIDMGFHLFDFVQVSMSWCILSIRIFVKNEWDRCEVLLWVNLNVVLINISMVFYIRLMCLWVIINQYLWYFWVTCKITISPMRNILSTQRLDKFSEICGHPGVRIFFSNFWVDNIDFASPDNHLSTLYSVFPLKHGIMVASVPMRQFMRRRTRQTLHW